MKGDLGQLGRLRHFTPLRYPGGKGKLAPFVKKILEANSLLDGEYIEPYAGGAAIGLELLFHEFVSRIHINDLSRPVYAFWHSVLHQTEEMCRLVNDTRRTIEEWDRQKNIFRNSDDHDDLTLGFAFFFLNRTNRSGILNGGVIGGRAQTGEWKIEARYNARELTSRIEAIARMESRIELTNLDAVQFIRSGTKRWPKRALIYCDPPYYVKGRDLYYHFYDHHDHEDVSKTISAVSKQKWIVSYDNVSQIRDIYKKCRYVIYDIGYSARSARQGSEVMFFADGLEVPAVVGALVETSRTESIVI